MRLQIKHPFCFGSINLERLYGTPNFDCSEDCKDYSNCTKETKKSLSPADSLSVQAMPLSFAPEIFVCTEQEKILAKTSSRKREHDEAIRT